ncbi:MAG: flagellar hook-associated protein FlgK [Clostridiaceae bacterium]|nr:flagellar hook-associated protein FlgK [Clostridiaceae bacterium]
MSGLFSIFSVGVRGMTAQQTALSVTSHNIANANTEGYTRQRALIQATKSFDGTGLANAVSAGQLGSGSEVTTIQRVRDSFLDYQVRNETSTQGQFSSRDTTLSEIEGIFNEPSDSGISSLLGKFFDSWQELSKQPQSSNSRTVVAQQSVALANELNQTYTQLQNIKNNINSVVSNSVFDTNNILNQIDKLNKQIIIVKVSNQEPNDLMDKRDILLDTLSYKFGINIEKKNFYGEAVTPVVEMDSTNPTNVNDPLNNLPANPNLITSKDNSEARRFSYIGAVDNIKDASGNPTTQYKITYYKNGDMITDENKVQINVDLGSNAATPAEIDQRLEKLLQNRVIWADKTGVAINGDGSKSLDGTQPLYNFSDLKLFQPATGEFKGYSSVLNDTNMYIDQINKIAKVLAFCVNGLQSGIKDVSGTTTTATDPPNNDFMPFFVNSDVADGLYNSSSIIPTGATGLDLVLASEKNINAGNLSVNKEIINDVMKIKTKTNDDKFAYTSSNNIDGDKDNARVLAIAGLRNNLINVTKVGITINSRADFFDPLQGGNTLTGTNFQNNVEGMSIDSYFKDIVDKLGIQEQEAQRMVKNQQNLLDSFSQSRQSVSGVSLDEEMANMVQYQHCYQANAKIIQTVDQLLEVVINGLKR